MANKAYDSVSEALSSIEEIDPLNFQFKCSELLARAIVWDFTHDPDDDSVFSNLELALSEGNLALRDSLNSHSIFKIQTKSPDAAMSVLCYMSNHDPSSDEELREYVEDILVPRLKEGEVLNSSSESELDDFFRLVTLLDEKATALWRTYQMPYYSKERVNH